jgi:hypothetical protein
MKFKSDIEAQAGFKDAGGDLGSAGQLLSSTGAETNWVDASTVIGGPYLPLVGGTMIGTNGVLFPDNFKLKIGTGSDLQIYHDGSNSYINESGTGRLILSGGSDIQLQSPAGELMADLNSNGSVDLYYDNSKKFETTSTGVSVTGIVEATGGNSTEWNTAYDNSIVSATVTGSTTKTLTLNQQDGGTVFANWSDETGSNNYVTSASFNTGDGVLTLNRSGLSAVTVDLDGRYLTGNQTITLSGDVTGSGTTSISTNIAANVVGAAELNVSGNGTAGQVLTSDGDGTFSWTTLTTGGLTGSGTTNYIPKFTGSTSLGNSQIFDSGTNVGIGTSFPGAKLSIGGVSGELLRLDDSSATGSPYMTFYQAGGRRSYIQHVDSSDLLTFASEYGGMVFLTGTGGTEVERMRILADGSVGINTTAPTEKLAVTGNIETTETANGVKIGFNVGDSFTLNGANTAHYGLSCGSSTSVPLVLSGYHGVAIATNGLERVRILNSNGNVGINETNPAEKLEVVGNIKANNYINQRVAWNSSFAHTAGTNAWYYIPVAYIVEQTGDTYFSNWIAAYGGRVRKIVLRGAGTGPTQTATTTQFRVMVNGSTVFTTTAQTVVGTSPNKVASYEFGDSDAVFSAKDRVQVLFNANGVWQNAAVGIIIEYTE